MVMDYQMDSLLREVSLEINEGVIMEWFLLIIFTLFSLTFLSGVYVGVKYQQYEINKAIRRGSFKIEKNDF